MGNPALGFLISMTVLKIILRLEICNTWFKNSIQDHFGVRYSPIFVQISRTIDQRGILFSHSGLKDLPEKDILEDIFNAN